MLITVIVITYNSSEYVLETLDSVFRQTYQNIQLIISDDCSTDNTIEICQSWLDCHQKRFFKPSIISTHVNGGICANYNNGLKYAQGQWIKYIAGDDYLANDCIEQFVKRALVANEKEKILISGTIPFTEDRTFAARIPPIHFFEGGSRDIERIIVRLGTIIEGPTMFIDTQVLRSLGGFDNCYPFIEDYPLYMKFLANDYVIRLVAKPLIYYRIHPDSVSRSDERFADSIYSAIDKYGRAAAIRNHMFVSWWHLTIDSHIRRLKKRGAHPLAAYALRAADPLAYKRIILAHSTHRIG